MQLSNYLNFLLLIFTFSVSYSYGIEVNTIDGNSFPPNLIMYFLNNFPAFTDS